MVCDAFSVLANRNISVEKHQVGNFNTVRISGDVTMTSSLQQTDLSGVVTQATSFLMYCVPHALQYHMRFLLTSLVHGRDHFHQFKVCLCSCEWR
jgi:hypothetical protein